MIIKELKLIVFSLCIVLLISACATTTKTGATKTYAGGTSGLSINFEKDAPPPEVTDGESFPFNIVLRLVNEGEASVKKEDVNIRISGFSPRDFKVAEASLINQHPQSDLAAKSVDQDSKIIEGGTVFATIPPQTGSSEADYLKVVKLSGNTDFTIKADLCYPYAAEASARLCVLKDLLSVDDKDLCNPNGAGVISSSGSPIQFSNFRQSVAGKDQISFSFDVVHSGNGDVFEDAKDANSQTYCPVDDSRERLAKQDKVKFTINLNDETLQGLRCNSIENGYIRLISGRRTVICSLDLSGKHNSDFEKIITFTAGFNYHDSKEAQLLVKHLPSIS